MVLRRRLGPAVPDAARHERSRVDATDAGTFCRKREAVDRDADGLERDTLCALHCCTDPEATDVYWRRQRTRAFDLVGSCAADTVKD